MMTRFLLFHHTQDTTGVQSLTSVVITDYPQLRARAKRNGSGMLRAAQRPQVVSDMKAGKREWPL
jgi:hypothetical protein